MRKDSLSCIIISIFATAFLFCAPEGLFAQNAYITNANSNNVSVINTVTNKVIATIPASTTPDGVVVSPDGTRAYISYYGNPINMVSIINTATNTIIDSIILSPGYGADGIDISPDGTTLYVPSIATSDYDTVYVVNTSNKMILAAIPLPTSGSVECIAVSPNGSKVYVADQNSVAVINTSDNALGTPISTGSGFLYGIAVTPNASKVYATKFAGGNPSIAAINTATNSLDILIQPGSGSQPWGVAIKPDGSKVYVSDYTKKAVYVINPATNIITDSVLIGNSPYGLAVTPDGSKIYVASINTGKVFVISTSSNTIIDSVSVGISPAAFGKFIGPSPGKLCVGGTGILTSNLSGTVYQWQKSTDGVIFNDISNNANYSGVNSAILQLSNIPSDWYGHQYRCVVDAVNGNPSVLYFTSTWMGTAGSNWESAANWTCGSVPDSNTDVIINSGTVILNANTTVRSLKVSPNASVAVNPGVTLTVTH